MTSGFSVYMQLSTHHGRWPWSCCSASAVPGSPKPSTPTSATTVTTTATAPQVTRKGGKTARVALAPPVVRALDDYLGSRTTGRIFVARDGESRYSYKTANEQITRLCRQAGLPAGVTPHSLRHSYATSPYGGVPRCRTFRTPSATPTPVPPAGTTAAATTSTAPPTTCLRLS